MVKKNRVGRSAFFFIFSFLLQTYINSDRVTASRGYGQRARFQRGIIQKESKNKMADQQISGTVSVTKTLLLCENFKQSIAENG